MSELDTDKIYPYVVPGTYVPDWEDGSFVSWRFKHDLEVMLVSDLGHTVSSVHPKSLEQIGMADDEAWDIAFRNLNNDWADGRMWVNVLNGEEGERCLVVENHWSAAATILLPSMQQVAAERLGSPDFFAFIPDASFLLFFQKKRSPKLKNTLDRIISDRSALFRKRLTQKLFLFGESGIAESEDTW